MTPLVNAKIHPHPQLSQHDPSQQYATIATIQQQNQLQTDPQPTHVQYQQGIQAVLHQVCKIYFKLLQFQIWFEKTDVEIELLTKLLYNFYFQQPTLVSQPPQAVLESSNDVIIQNLVVPSNLLSVQHHSNEPININIPTQEVEVPPSTPKTSSGIILEARTSSEAPNTITACQIPTKTSQNIPPFEESITSMEQVNSKVKI